MCAALPKYSGGKKALIQTCAVGTGLLTYYVAKTTNFLVKNAYSRRVERIADEGVINTHDEKTINIRKKYFQKMHMSEQVQKCFDPTFVPETDLPLLLRTYPTYGERIARCDEALAQLEAAKK